MFCKCGFIVSVLILPHFKLIRNLLTLAYAIGGEFVTVGSTARTRSGISGAAWIIHVVGGVLSLVVVAEQVTLTTIADAPLAKARLLNLAFQDANIAVIVEGDQVLITQDQILKLCVPRQIKLVLWLEFGYLSLEGCTQKPTANFDVFLAHGQTVSCRSDV